MTGKIARGSYSGEDLEESLADSEKTGLVVASELLEGESFAGISLALVAAGSALIA